MTLGIGFIGAGLAMRDLHVPALASLGRLGEVRAVAASSQRSSAEAAEWLADKGAKTCRPDTVDGILADPTIDVVLVAVPIALTASVTARVLESQKAALVEKPIATSTAEALRLLASARALDVPLLAGENFRFKAEYKRMKDLATVERIGEVRVIYWNDLHFTPADGKYAKTSWRIEGEHSGGYLVDGGTHVVAGLRQLSDQRIVAVHALATSAREYLSAQEDTLLINLTYDGGAIGHLALGYGVFDPDARRPKICGTKGTLALLDDGIHLITESGTELLEKRSTSGGFDDEWALLIEAVGDAGQREETYRLTLESVRDLQLIESARESSVAGQPIELEALGD